MTRLDAHFAIAVPFARAINPITKKNWESTGVEPDVKVASGEPLDTAKKLAARRQMANDPQLAQNGTDTSYVLQPRLLLSRDCRHSVSDASREDATFG